MKYYKFLILILVFVFSTGFAKSPQANDFKSYFDVQAASKDFAAINNKKFKLTEDVDSLQNNVDRLEDFQQQASSCATKSMLEIQLLDNLLSNIQEKHLLEKQQSDYNYLQAKKTFYTKQLYECKLYAYRSKEAIVTYKNNIQKLSAHKLLQRTSPVWQLFHSELWSSFGKINVKPVYAASGISQLSQTQIIAWLLLVAIGMMVAIYIRYLCRLWFNNHSNSGSFIFALIKVLSVMIIPITIAGVSSAVLEATFYGQINDPILESFCDLTLMFIALFTVVKYLFYPSKTTANPLGIPIALAKTIYARLTLFLSWLFFGYVISAVFANQSLPQVLIDFAETLYISLFIVILVWAFSAFYRLPLLQRFNHRVIVFFEIVLSLLLLSMLLIEWLGFHMLALYLLTALSLSLGLVVLAMGLWSLVTKCYQLISNTHYSAAKKAHRMLGVKFHKKIQEFSFLKYISYLLIVTASVIFLMRIWRVSPVVVDKFTEHLISGFKLSGVEIQPLHIVLGIVIFSLLLLSGRFIATLTAKRYNSSGEADAQIAVASIIVYTAFSIALLIALVIMGVNFTGLAIIAGALSVGIGLGLQNIVNNFVSGIILLLEKPIKPGDRIIIGKTEGFVKKIRLRSTQIATLAKEDVIIPNSDLITLQVTNFMFRDKQWRIVCPVGVAYGSDVELVKQVLLAVAARNKSVIQEVPNEPVVLFRNFGDSSLLFELWCIIEDVNEKYKVISEVNFAIDHAFRENNITIAFPQRDVHIKK